MWTSWEEKKVIDVYGRKLDNGRSPIFQQEQKEPSLSK